MFSDKLLTHKFNILLIIIKKIKIKLLTIKYLKSLLYSKI